MSYNARFIGEHLRLAQTLYHLSSMDLAEKLNVSRETISYWRRNITAITETNLKELSKIFRCQPENLIDARGKTNKCKFLKKNQLLLEMDKKIRLLESEVN